MKVVWLIKIPSAPSIRAYTGVRAGGVGCGQENPPIYQNLVPLIHFNFF